MCHNSTLHGKYGFYRTGTHTAMGVTTHLAAAGFMVFNGAGAITAYQNASEDGVFVADSQTTGYYHVYESCVFTLSQAPYDAGDGPIDLTKVMTVGVIVDGGKELFALSTQAGRAMVFIAKKM